MIRIENKHLCCGCQACAQICPKSCITMQPDEEGFLYPVVDEAACINCGLCEKACPVLNSTESVRKSLPMAYAAYNLDEKIRLASSSGGIFTLLAEDVLEKNGVVYGAAMVGGVVKHIRVDTLQELEVLRGSKYVQSDIGKTYLQAKKDLEEGKTVLFTGTPCQVEGLKSFLQKEYENLLCLDLICYGVPSPLVWQQYVAFREKKAKARAVRMSFRHKKYGWKTYALSIDFSNDSAYVCRHRYDLFMRAFLNDLCLRPSCHYCAFKKVNRISDITVADFWGIDVLYEDMDDDKGTSLVIIHSEKGSRIFSNINQHTKYHKVDFEKAIKGNPAMIRSAKCPENRTGFMQKIHNTSINMAVKEHTKNPYLTKRTIKEGTKSILKKLRIFPLIKGIKNKKG